MWETSCLLLDLIGNRYCSEHNLQCFNSDTCDVFVYTVINLEKILNSIVTKLTLNVKTFVERCLLSYLS